MRSYTKSAMIGMFCVTSCAPTAEESSLAVAQVETVHMADRMCSDSDTVSEIQEFTTTGVNIIAFHSNVCGEGFELQDTPGRTFIHLNMGGSGSPDRSVVSGDTREIARLRQVPGAQVHNLRGTPADMVRQIRELNGRNGGAGIPNPTFIVSGHGNVVNGKHAMGQAQQIVGMGPGGVHVDQFQTDQLLQSMYDAAGVTPERPAQAVISACFAGQAGTDCRNNASVASRSSSILTSSAANQTSSEVRGGGAEQFLKSYADAQLNPTNIPDSNGNRVIDTEDLASQANVSMSQRVTVSTPNGDIIGSQTAQEYIGPAPIRQ